MGTNTLAPGLLLAAPRLGDPNFERTVVLLAKHGAEGAIGWIVNGREIGPVAELLENSGLLPEEGAPDSPGFAHPVRLGGPVSTESGWVLYRTVEGNPLGGEIDAGGGLGITGDASVLRTIVHGGEPRDFRLLIGYAGWGPGQLEGEVQTGSWLPTPVDAALLLDGDPETLWDRAYQRFIGANPGAFVSTRGGSA